MEPPSSVIDAVLLFVVAGVQPLLLVGLAGVVVLGVGYAVSQVAGRTAHDSHAHQASLPNVSLDEDIVTGVHELDGAELDRIAESAAAEGDD